MTLFLRMLQEEDKAAALDDALAAMRRGEADARVFEVAPEEFAKIPGTPFAYWAESSIRDIFSAHSSFVAENRIAQLGASTKDDFRFLRAWWEVHESREGSKWIPFAKGGGYSLWYSDLCVVVNWGDDAKELESAILKKYPYLGKSANWVLHRENKYFEKGITWPLRAKKFCPQPLPKNAIFSVRGYAAFVPEAQLLSFLGLFGSTGFDLLFKLNLGRFGFPEFLVGILNRMPIPSFGSDAEALACRSRRAWEYCYNIDRAVENSHAFWLPGVLQVTGDGLAKRATAWNEGIKARELALLSIQSEIDNIAFRLYNVSADDRRSMEHGAVLAAAAEKSTEEEFDEADIEDCDTEGSDSSMLVGQLLSWCVGVAFGRWDLRCATGEREMPPEPDPFDPLPSRAPGALESELTVEWLLDDPDDRALDLVTQVKEVLASLQGASDWVGEACRILGVSDLRDWFRRKFFELHLKVYSKSRRKAPLYLPLSVPSGRFAVWLYAPAIHKDSLWRVLQEVAKPRLDLESRRYWDLKGEVGDAPSRDQVRELDERESLVRELQRFVADLEQAAPLWNPNLDDGTVLCAAVLHRLFQHSGWRKECETKWRDLEALKYPWAHISLHLWPERVLPLCHRDRSLAIAHDLEEDFWEQDKDENWKPRKLDDAALQTLSARFRSATVGTALQSFGAARLDASGDSSPKIKATRGRKPKAAKPEQMGLGLE